MGGRPSPAASVVEIPVYSSKLRALAMATVHYTMSSAYMDSPLEAIEDNSISTLPKPTATQLENLTTDSWSRDAPCGVRHRPAATASAFWRGTSAPKTSRWNRRTGCGCVAVTADSRASVTSLDGGEIVFWRGRNRQPQARISMGALFSHPKTISPDLRYLTGTDSLAGLWNLKTGDRLAAFEAGTWGYGQTAWAPDGRTVAFVRVTEDPEVVQFLRPFSGEPDRAIRLPKANYFAYTSVSWSPDGTQVLVTGSADAVISVASGTVKSLAGGRGRFVWAPSGDLVRRATPIPLRIWDILQSPDYRYAALRGDNKDLVVWDTQEDRVLWTAIVPNDRTLMQVAWSPDSQQLAYVSDAGIVDVWDLHEGQVVARWTAPNLPLWRGFSYLTWHSDLVAVEHLGGAIRLGQAR